MPRFQPPETGTMVIAGLLLLALGFAGYWIDAYVSDRPPWSALPWFGLAAAVIVLLGLIAAHRGGKGGDRDAAD